MTLDARAKGLRVDHDVVRLLIENELHGHDPASTRLHDIEELNQEAAVGSAAASLVANRRRTVGHPVGLTERDDVVVVVVQGDYGARAAAISHVIAETNQAVRANVDLVVNLPEEGEVEPHRDVRHEAVIAVRTLTQDRCRFGSVRHGGDSVARK